MGTILKKKNMFTSINYNDSSQRVTLIAYSKFFWSKSEKSKDVPKDDPEKSKDVPKDDPNGEKKEKENEVGEEKASEQSINIKFNVSLEQGDKSQSGTKGKDHETESQKAGTPQSKPSGSRLSSLKRVLKI